MCACVCVFARTLWHVAHGSRRRTADAGTATAMATTATAAAAQLISPASFLSHTIFRTLLPCLVPVAASTFVLCAIKKRKKEKYVFPSLIAPAIAQRCVHTHIYFCQCVCAHTYQSCNGDGDVGLRMPPWLSLFRSQGHAAVLHLNCECVCMCVRVQYGACFNVTTFQWPKKQIHCNRKLELSALEETFRFIDTLFVCYILIIIKVYIYSKSKIAAYVVFSYFFGNKQSWLIMAIINGLFEKFQALIECEFLIFIGNTYTYIHIHYAL